MSSEALARSKEIFLAALGVRGEERLRLLEARCAGNSALRAEIESLLKASEHTDSFLESPALARGAAGDEADALPGWLAPGAKIGRYTLVRQLGAGGMGVVFAAQQDAPRRTVALKLMRPGCVGPGLLRRFTREAAVLGMLKHPGIAQVYEAGTETASGAAVPYLAMELVEGVSLTEWARRTPGLRERIGAIAQVCDAVAHAHQRGVIHRDLKPANVLVDASGAVKVLDFGIARLVEGDEPGMTVHTAAGMILGTLAYMSPEQVSGDPARVDVRSDVYSLGALMFDTLAGRTPIEVDGLSVHEAVRRIAEHEPARLGAAARELRGDLDTIAAKALEKDPARRYQSASEMGEDLRRFLRHEPILARPASAAYTVRKFARRHRAVVAGVLGVFVALVAGLATTMVQARRARAAADSATAINGFLQEMLRSVEPDRGGKDTTVREVLDHASATLDARFSDRPVVRAGLHEAIASSYLALGRFADSESHARSASDIYRDMGLEGTAPGIRAAAALASAQMEQGRYRETIEPLRGALRAADAAGLSDSAEAINVRTELAFACESEGLFEEAERLHREIVESTRRRLGGMNRATIMTESNLGLFLIDRGNLVEAEEILERARGSAVRTMGADSEAALTTTINLSVCYSRAGRPAEAEPLMRDAVKISERVLGPTHPETIHQHANLAITLTELGRLEEADGEITSAVEVARERFGLRDERTLHALGVAARLRLAQRRPEEALHLAQEQYGGCVALYGRENQLSVESANLVTKVLEDSGRPDEARAWKRGEPRGGAAPAFVGTASRSD